ncbi:hypothetical protein QAD02_021989 [Eretmocerus hayati]|uniref:Uncharacterized protein n=1 Tax=Eretmocerus hayati TaxID=131215 RepID=A0ACC2PS13_9HYME|nr:hypothetical protein QAD02_021989 [Eretmocerus hayati]
MCEKVMDQVFWQSFDETISRTLVPSFASKAVRPCATSDYAEYRELLTENLERIILYLDTLLKNREWKTSKVKIQLIKVVVIIGEHSSENVWNTRKATDLLQLVISRMCALFSVQKVSQFLIDNVFSEVIMFLRPKLMKDSWKSHPAAVVCYEWLLQSVEKPLLRHHLPDVIPTALIILDDYDTNNQKVGLNCVSMIMRHCQDNHSLKNLNYDEVIFYALDQMAYKLDVSLVEDLYSCISNLLKCIEFYQRPSERFRWSRRDDVIMALLTHMELQTHDDSRIAYATSLKMLLNQQNIGKWSERLAGIIAEYCEDVNNLMTVDLSLNILSTLLSTYLPIGPNFVTTIFTSLIKLCCKITSSGECNNELIQKVGSALLLLTNKYSSIGQELESNPIVTGILKSILRTSETSEMS